MIVPYPPRSLKDIVSINLANYQLQVGYYIEFPVTCGGFFPLRCQKDQVFYCESMGSARAVIDYCRLRNFVIRSRRFLVRTFSGDPQSLGFEKPHAFSLDDPHFGLEVPCERVFTDPEVLDMIHARVQFKLPDEPNLHQPSAWAK